MNHINVFTTGKRSKLKTVAKTDKKRNEKVIGS